MKIKDNIQNVINTILQERAMNGSSATEAEVERKAIPAIIAGQKQPGTEQITPEWDNYMRLYAGTPTNIQQLARLTASDGTITNAAMQRERAYLLGNGMCGGTTTDTTLDGNVTAALDQD
jgi:hypothetical protein